jgi:hypothetical protein
VAHEKVRERGVCAGRGERGAQQRQRAVGPGLGDEQLRDEEAEAVEIDQRVDDGLGRARGGGGARLEAEPVERRVLVEPRGRAGGLGAERAERGGERARLGGRDEVLSVGGGAVRGCGAASGAARSAARTGLDQSGPLAPSPRRSTSIGAARTGSQFAERQACCTGWRRHWRDGQLFFFASTQHNWPRAAA